MNKDFMLTTISYGEEYHERARRLAKGLKGIGLDIAIFTDGKGIFDDLSNVKTFPFLPRKQNLGCFSGYDKDRVALEVLKIADCFWYIDSDWVVNKNPNPDLIRELKIRPGLTSARPPQREIHSAGYPQECIDLARNKYKVTRPLHHHEFCYAIKKDNGKEIEYLKILLELGDLHDEIEISRQKKAGKGVFISRSSGVSFGFASQASGFYDNSRRHKHAPFRRCAYANFTHIPVHSPT